MKKILRGIIFTVLTVLMVFSVSLFAFSASSKKSSAPVPVLQSAVNTKSGIKISWQAAKGMEKYTVHRKTQGGKWKKLKTVTKGTSYVDTTAKEGEKYYYTVKGIKGDKVSKWNREGLSAYRLVSPDITSLSSTAEGITVKWEKAKGAKSYIVYRKPDGGKWKKLATIKKATTLSYKDKTVESNKKYSYFIKAVNGKSKSVNNKNEKTKHYLKAPEKFSLKQDSKTVTLSWKSVSGASKYGVYKKVGDGKWKKLGEVKNAKSGYTDKSVSITKKASYRIRAFGKNVTGAYTKALSIRYIDPKKPMVALTYDDGPHPTHTNTILDVLEKYNARATFFVVGERIGYYSDCLVRQNELGCEIANHSFSHVYLSGSSKKTVINEMNKTNELIKRYSGQTCKIARAPGGSPGKALSLVDMPFIYWSIDTMDWDSRSSSAVVSVIKRQVRDGSIILMHDLYKSTADASKVIIPWLIKEGYQLVTVSEMMEVRGIKMTGGKMYYNAYK